MDTKMKPGQYLDVSDQPVLRILIISDSGFLGYSLSESLLQKEMVEINFLKNSDSNFFDLKKIKKNKRFSFVKKDTSAVYDYVFHINILPVEKQKIKPMQSIKISFDKKAKYLLATVNKQNYEKSYFSGFTRNSKVDYRLVYFNFVYGPSRQAQSLMEIIFSQVSQGKITLPEKPEERVYPLYVDDFIQGVLRSMFSSESAGEAFFLTGKERISVMDFALKIKNFFPGDLEIKQVNLSFAKGWQVDALLLPKIKKSWWSLVYKPKTDFDTGINKTLQNYNNERKSFLSFLPKLPRVAFLDKLFPEITLTVRKKSMEKSFLFINIILLAIFILFFPLIISLLSAFVGYKKVEGLVASIETGNIIKAQAQAQAQKTKDNFLFSRKIILGYSSVFSFFPPTKQLQKIQYYYDLGISVSEGFQTGLEVLSSGEVLSGIIFENKNADPQKEIDTLLLQMNKLQEQLALAQLNADRTKDTDILFAKQLSEQNKKLASLLPEWRNKLILSRKIVSLFPELLAFDQKKKYLILLQNNMELRPTGGFIGSYALLTLDKGRFIDLAIKDVYDADGQLKGHVEPPKAIKDYLGEANWYLRDSNFSPDFPTSAIQAEWFLQKETGETVDGTIAINLDFLKSLLEITGPVEVQDYNETITTDNLFEKAESHSENDFFPGSDQKKSFLTALSFSLFEKLKSLNGEKSLDLLSSFYNGLEKKEVIFYFHDHGLEKRIQALGWTGEVKNISFGKTGDFKGPGLVDYLMIVEANLGVNKANYFIQRKVEMESTVLENGQTVDQLKISYLNKSTSQSWPGGTYKNFLRLIIPSDIKKLTAKQKTNTEPVYKTLQSIESEENKDFGKSVFSFLVQVAPQETKQLVFTYQREELLPIVEKVFDYVAYFQKQPGTGNDNFVFKLNYPVFIKPTKIMPDAKINSQNITFETDWDSDKLFAIEFSR